MAVHSTRRATPLLFALVASLLAATAVQAQPQNHRPASALVFPCFDSRDGSLTIITVTNTNTDQTECDETRRAGDVLLHYQYVSDATFLEFDRYEFLTPGDTLSIRTDLHNPEGELGYLLVSATRRPDSQSIVVSDFDHLVGSAIIVRASDETALRYAPYAFQAVAESPDACSIVSTDTDADGALDFDGVEYVRFPRELLTDSFFEEGGRITNELVLVSSARSQFTSELEFLMLNNQGDLYTGALLMNGWWTGSISDLTPIASDLNGDPGEFGSPALETGWLLIRGKRIFDSAGNPVLDAQGGFAVAPVVGFLAERIRGTQLSMGGVLQHRGALDGLELVSGNQDPQDNGSGL